MSGSSKPRTVLYCESNVDGTIGGSHYCLLGLVENIDRTVVSPLVVFYENHALVPRFRASADTFVLPPPTPVNWGMGGTGLRSLLVRAVRRCINLAKHIGRVFSLMSFLRRHEVALVHQNNSITRHHDLMTAALLLRIPCIAHERGTNRSFSWADRNLARRLARIIPVSRSIMAFMVAGRVVPDNLLVLYDGLDPARIGPARHADEVRRAYGVGSNQPVVCMIGNIRVWKGQETVVRALIEVVRTHPDLVCFFVGASTPGDKPYHDKLNAMVDAAGIGANVRFTGYQSDPASFVNMASVVVHASVEPEPFGMVVLEAMAQGKPVIGSRAGGVVEMIVEGKTGYTFTPGDAAELARYLTHLIADPDQARRMGQSGYQRVIESFSMSGYIRDIHAVYRDALGEVPLPADVGIRPRPGNRATPNDSGVQIPAAEADPTLASGAAGPRVSRREQ